MTGTFFFGIVHITSLLLLNDCPFDDFGFLLFALDRT
jgi:hypothetical protein